MTDAPQDGSNPSGRSLDELAVLLDGAASAHRHLGMARRGREALGLPYLGDLSEDLPTAERAVAWALDYHVETIDAEGRRRVTLVPKHEHADGSEPPYVSDVESDIVKVWSHLLQLVKEPAAKARLAHLLVERGGTGRSELTVTAAEAYLASAAVDERSMDAVGDLTAATRLARSVGDQDLTVRSLEQMTVLVEELLTEPDPPAGIVLRALRHLVGERNSPERLDDLIEKATAAWTDPHRKDGALEVLLERSTTPEARAVVWRRRVAAYTDAAETEDSALMRATRLQRALALADASGIADLRAATTKRLQAVRHDQIEMIHIQASSRRYEEEFQEMVAETISGDGWQTALIGFATSALPSGDPERNREVVRGQHAAFPLGALFPTQLLGADSLPLYAGTSEHDRFDLDLTRWESDLISQMSRILGAALTELPERHSLPSEAELVEFLLSWPGLDQFTAPPIARSLLRYWTGDLEGAAFTVVPRLETIARGLLLRLDVAIYRAQRERTPGQYASLGTLLQALHDQGLLDEASHRYLTALLTKPSGLRLRHDTLHGFISNVGLGGTALLMHAALLLGTLNPHTGPSDDTP